MFPGFASVSEKQSCDCPPRNPSPVCSARSRGYSAKTSNLEDFFLFLLKRKLTLGRHLITYVISFSLLSTPAEEVQGTSSKTLTCTEPGSAQEVERPLQTCPSQSGSRESCSRPPPSHPKVSGSNSRTCQHECCGEHVRRGASEGNSWRASSPQARRARF